MLAGDPDNLKKNIEILKDLKYSILFIGAPEKDFYGKLWNLNMPLYKYGIMRISVSITACKG